ncbi:MAG: chorismate lyase [Pseudomonadota bacterium]
MKSSLIWQADIHAFASINPKIQAWLQDSDSLTEKLQNYYPEFQLKLLSQKWNKILTSEMAVLKKIFPQLYVKKPEQDFLIRQIYLCCQNKPMIYARTVIPKPIAHKFKTLGTKPIGKILIDKLNLPRSKFFYRLIDPADSLYAYVNFATKRPTETLHARLSWFEVEQYPLLITEVFTGYFDYP